MRKEENWKGCSAREGSCRRSNGRQGSSSSRRRSIRNDGKVEKWIGAERRRMAA